MLSRAFHKLRGTRAGISIALLAGLCTSPAFAAAYYNLTAFWRSEVSGYILTCDSGSANTTCTISTVHTIPNDAICTNVTGNLVIASGGNLQNTSGNQIFQLTVGGSVTINSGGEINTNILLNAGSVTVSSGGSIIVDGLGYPGVVNGTGGGLGGGIGSASSGGGGGGHGGATEAQAISNPKPDG